jgi:hypothetical protein
MLHNAVTAVEEDVAFEYAQANRAPAPEAPPRSATWWATPSTANWPPWSRRSARPISRAKAPEGAGHPASSSPSQYR